MTLEILIIEDSVLIGKKLKELISENISDYMLRQAKSITEALRMVTELNPNVVFLDINLPDGNGMQVLTHLKKLNQKIKVIIFSNAANDFYRRKFMENGCDYFLDKSKDFTQIPQIISSLVA
jgi:DNA-binding NarL/FixJ family response regulator